MKNFTSKLFSLSIFFLIARVLEGSPQVNLDILYDSCNNREDIISENKPLLNYLIKNYPNYTDNLDCQGLVNYYKNQYSLVISGDDNISSLELLSEFTHLEKLYLLNLPGIEGLNPLHNLINLEELSIHHSPKVVNIDALLDMNCLRDVSLFDTRVSHIDALASKPYLRRIDLYNNPVQDLATILNLNSLTYFSANSTNVAFEQVETIVKNNPNLERLDIRGLEVSNDKISKLRQVNANLYIIR